MVPLETKPVSVRPIGAAVAGSPGVVAISGQNAVKSSRMPLKPCGCSERASSWRWLRPYSAGSDRIRDLNDAWLHMGGNLIAVVLAAINWYPRFVPHVIELRGFLDAMSAICNK